MVFPTTIQQAAARPGIIRAGGTDLLDLARRAGISGPVVDLRDVSGQRNIQATEDGGLRIGGLVTLASLADDPQVAAMYPAVSLAAASIAGPGIRAVATVGGNLLQEVRCWYSRNPHFDCLRSGGRACWARMGDNLYHVAFDREICAAPSPSTLALAFVAHDALLETHDAALHPISGLHKVFDRQKRTQAGRPVLAAVILPAPSEGQLSSYLRVSARPLADWPLVELALRMDLAGGLVREARLVLGAVSQSPLRIPAAERALVGWAPGSFPPQEIERAIRDSARPLPMTSYKVDLAAAAVRDGIMAALENPP